MGTNPAKLDAESTLEVMENAQICNISLMR